MLSLIVYNFLLLLFMPVIYIYLLVRRGQGKEDAAHWGQRWGYLPGTVTQDRRTPRFWIHAVSVGEVMAAIPVVREVRRRHPDAFIVLSTITPTGREVALKQIPPADEVVYFPLDFSWSVNRALEAVRPDTILLMEWEIWPIFLAAARKQGATIAVLNGRISDKGLRRGLKARFFTRPGLEAVHLFCMQSDEDARRAALVGVLPDKIRTLGNTKFDESAVMLTLAERAVLREELCIPADAPVWVCGSTRPGEEEIIARAAEIVRQTVPDLFLIVAPRHLDRADEAAAPFPGIRRRSVERRAASASMEPFPPTTVRVLLLDTFGELAKVYAVARVAFVGGSLKPFGGQSVFQPLAQGVPALFGPYMNNQRDIAALAQAEGVGFLVRDADTLSAAVIHLLTLPDSEFQAVSAKARGLIERNQGVAARCLDTVEQTHQKQQGR